MDAINQKRRQAEKARLMLRLLEDRELWDPMTIVRLVNDGFTLFEAREYLRECRRWGVC